MIVTTRTLNCNDCGEWLEIEDSETAVDARRRARKRGWTSPPTVGVQVQHRADYCPKCSRHD